MELQVSGDECVGRGLMQTRNAGDVPDAVAAVAAGAEAPAGERESGAALPPDAARRPQRRPDRDPGDADRRHPRPGPGAPPLRLLPRRLLRVRLQPQLPLLQPLRRQLSPVHGTTISCFLSKEF